MSSFWQKYDEYVWICFYGILRFTKPVPWNPLPFFLGDAFVRVVGKEPMSWELQLDYGVSKNGWVECLKFADCESGIVSLICLLINVWKYQLGESYDSLSAFGSAVACAEEPATRAHTLDPEDGSIMAETWPWMTGKNSSNAEFEFQHVATWFGGLKEFDSDIIRISRIHLFLYYLNYFNSVSL